MSQAQADSKETMLAYEASLQKKLNDLTAKLEKEVSEHETKRVEKDRQHDHQIKKLNGHLSKLEEKVEEVSKVSSSLRTEMAR
jgi:cell division septum initiation protein DivIVA